MNAEQATSLRKPFPPEVIGKIPKGGRQLDYVGHAAVTDRLLQVDPDWSWEPMATDERGIPLLDAAGNLWIRLTVCGVTRPGVGDGPDAKQLVSDALRNAAMRFGVALDLWAREDLHAANETRDETWKTIPIGDGATALVTSAKTSTPSLSGVDRGSAQSAGGAPAPESSGEQNAPEREQAGDQTEAVRGKGKAPTAQAPACSHPRTKPSPAERMAAKGWVVCVDCDKAFEKKGVKP